MCETGLTGSQHFLSNCNFCPRHFLTGNQGAMSMDLVTVTTSRTCCCTSEMSTWLFDHTALIFIHRGYSQSPNTHCCIVILVVLVLSSIDHMLSSNDME